MEYHLRLFSIVCAIAAAHAFFLNGRCGISPRNDHINWQPGDKEPEIEARVPDGCHNGTMFWSYPRGHLLLYVSNVNATPTSVCVIDHGVVPTFNVTDVTGGRNSPLTYVTGDSHQQCTSQTTAKEIVLNVQAPTMLLYVGGFQYLVKQAE